MPEITENQESHKLHQHTVSKRFSLSEIMECYENVTPQKETEHGKSFAVSNEKGHYMEVFDLGHNEIRFIKDNFPMPRRFFNTNIPYTSLEDFESDLRRMNLPIPPRKNVC